MKLFYPEIFDKFVCTGSQCSDNCCMTDWDIEIDEDTYGFYKKLDNELSYGRRGREISCPLRRQMPYAQQKGALLCSACLR